MKGILKVITVVLTASCLSRAELIVSDDFSYPNGTLQGNNGGTAGTSSWTETWTNNTNFVVNDGVATISAAGINSLRRNFSLTTADKTVYFSFTTGVSGETDDAYSALFSLYRGNNSVVELGISTNYFYVKNKGYIGTYTQGSTHQVVGKIEFDAGVSGQEILTVWIDPTSEASTSTSVEYETGYRNIDRVQLKGIGFNTGGTGSFDNIIIGSSFTDVAIPEPSTVGLFIISSASLFVLRQFRK